MSLLENPWYEEMLQDKIVRVSRAVREGALHEGMKAIMESIVIGGCFATDSVLTTNERSSRQFLCN
jgi:hypothetical protein